MASNNAYWVRLTSGDHAGACIPIIRKGYSLGDYIDLPDWASSFVAEEDEFELVRPSITISASSLLVTIEDLSSDAAPFTVCNTRIVGSSAEVGALLRVIGRTGIRMVLCVIDVADGDIAIDGGVNYAPGRDEDDATTGLAALTGDLTCDNLISLPHGPGAILRCPNGTVYISTPGPVRDLVVQGSCKFVDAQSNAARDGFAVSGTLTEYGVTARADEHDEDVEAIEALGDRVALLEQTTEEVTYYVAADGNDKTGDGSEEAPFATVDHALSLLPRRIAHKCKILVADPGEDSYGEGVWPTTIAPEFVADGSLHIVGVGAPDVVSGPYTSTGLATKSNGLCQRIAVSGATWTVDEFCGGFVRVAEGGSHPGTVYAVYGNGADWIDIGHYAGSSDKFVSGDAFEIVRPAITIPCSAGFTVSYLDQYTRENETYKNGRLVIHNLILDGSASTSTGELFSFYGGSTLGGPFFPFVLLLGPAGGSAYPILSVQGTIAVGGAYNFDYIADGETGLSAENLASVTEGPGLVVHTSAGRGEPAAVFLGGSCALAAVCVTGTLITDFSNCLADLSYCSMGNLSAGGSYGITVINGAIVIEGQAGQPGAVIRGHAKLKLWCARGSCAVQLLPGTRFDVHGSTACSPTDVTGQAIEIGGGCVVSTGSSLASFVGADVGGGAYKWLMTAAKAAAWPSTNKTGDSDALGSWVVRYD